MTSRISRERFRPLPACVKVAGWERVSSALIEQFELAEATNGWPMYLFGLAGRGKSCAAACLYCSWRGSARWHTADGIVRDILRCRTNGHGFIELTRGDDVFEITEADIFRKFAGADLCVLDDIGTRQLTDAQREIIQTLIDSRAGRPLVVTGNLSLAQLADVTDARIASRLSAGIICKMTGPDRRSAQSRIVEV